MLAELGRRADAALTRGTDAAHEAAHATVLHLRRIVGAVSVALTRVTKETRDLAWNYQDVAADLRRPSEERTQAGRDEPPQENVRPSLRVVGSEE
ncbi:hypothetical protein [Mycolicibacterium stellerae]|uniref:hypothetical protein n=1 Tax=Mycolicibacterium stellerae TaxID=2358193 RepID=UPI000F0B6120|nr:hypothetical protein [Mycolicibacterium stellerae]